MYRRLLVAYPPDVDIDQEQAKQAVMETEDAEGLLSRLAGWPDGRS